jgi:hypothetical protein
MPKIYEYFGLIFLFYSNDHNPVHVHVKYGEYLSKVEFIYEDGVLTAAKFIDVINNKGIPKSKEKEAVEFIKMFHAQIVQKWIQFFVFKVKPQNEKITRRIK